MTTDRVVFAVTILGLPLLMAETFLAVEDAGDEIAILWSDDAEGRTEVSTKDGQDGQLILWPIIEPGENAVKGLCEYEVEVGDTLRSIAQQHLGAVGIEETVAAWKDLYGNSVNIIGDDADQLEVGQIILLPTGSCK